MGRHPEVDFWVQVGDIASNEGEYFTPIRPLYWIKGNIISLIMQVSINKSKLGQEMHELAVRRAAKKKGSVTAATGRVIQGRR